MLRNFQTTSVFLKKKTPSELLFILCSFLLSSHFEVLKFQPIPFFISELGYFKAYVKREREMKNKVGRKK